MSFIKITDLKEVEVVPGFKGRFIHSDNITVAYWRMEKGGVIPVHAHIHEMIVNVIEGTLRLTIDNETREMISGMAAIIPSNVPHTATAITDCFVLDVFYPVREDYKAKSS